MPSLAEQIAELLLDGLAERIEQTLSPKFHALTERITRMDQRITDEVQSLRDDFAREKQETIDAVKTAVASGVQTIIDKINAGGSTTEIVNALETLKSDFAPMSDEAAAAAGQALSDAAAAIPGSAEPLG